MKRARRVRELATGIGGKNGGVIERERQSGSRAAPLTGTFGKKGAFYVQEPVFD
jgi:hypothetical protein